MTTDSPVRRCRRLGAEKAAIRAGAGMKPPCGGDAFESKLGTETIYVCTVPGTPPSLNEWQRWPWGKQERVRGEFQEMVWAVLSEKGNRCPRGFSRIECHAVLMFPRGARRDASNFGAVLWKLALDVLVREGVIPDDTAQHVTCHEPRIVTGDRALTVLTIKGWRDVEE